MFKLSVAIPRFCIFLAVLSIVSILSVTAKDDDKLVWVVTQHNKYIGDCTLYVGDDVVKFVGQNGQIELVTHGPAWNVVADRPKDKIGFSQSLSKFKDGGLKIWSGETMLAQAPKKIVYDPKLKVECYEMRSKASNNRSYDGNDPLIFKTAKKVMEREMQYRCTKSIALSESSKRFLAALYRQEEMTGIPIEMHVTLSDGSKVPEFTTTSLNQKKFPATFFAEPKNFKVVASNSPDMWLPKSSQKEFSNLIQDVMLGEPTSK